MTRTITLLTMSATAIAAAISLAAQTTQTKPEPSHHGMGLLSTKSALIENARRATEIYRDVSAASPDYAPLPACVAGPDEGAMGVHYVNGALLQDAELNVERPEALIYEFKDNTARLVGLEYIVFFDVWHSKHPPQETPALDGQLLNFVDAPNRFGLPPFYELHVWAWRDNPNGAFVDWNPKVSCEGQ